LKLITRLDLQEHMNEQDAKSTAKTFDTYLSPKKRETVYLEKGMRYGGRHPYRTVLKYWSLQDIITLYERRLADGKKPLLMDMWKRKLKLFEGLKNDI